MQKETMRQMREKYGIGERNVMRELKQEIENLNKIIDAATNSANASHLRAIEYQSQRDTLADKIEAIRPTLQLIPVSRDLLGALAVLKGGFND
jgi:hypothetical protein